jgi:hypothetical protein
VKWKQAYGGVLDHNGAKKSLPCTFTHEINGKTAAPFREEEALNRIKIKVF